MALTLSGDIAGLGKIVQIVRATDSTKRTTTSTSFVDVPGMSVAVTPQKADSTIIIVASFLVYSAGTTFNTRYQITDSVNAAISGAENSMLETAAKLAHQTLFGFATPATTSSVTYKLRFRSNGSGTSEIWNNENTGQMYAIEVAA